MSGDREKFDLDFGIEDTTRTSSDLALVDAVFTGGAIADPNSLQNNDGDDTSSTTQKTTTKAKITPPVNKNDKTNDTSKKDDTIEVDLEEQVLGDESANKDGEGDDTKGNQQPGKENDNQGVDKSTFASLAEDFVGLGLFEKLEEGEEFNPEMSPEEFMQLYTANKNREINDTINGFLGRFGEDYKDMFQAVFVDGVNPVDYLTSFTKLQDIGSLDITKEGDQERVYREYFRRQGFAADRIEAKLQKAKAQGDLEEDATDFHKILVEQDAEELAAKTKIKEQQTQQERTIKKTFAQNANKILVEKVKEKDYDGIPVTDQIARETFQYLTEEKYRLSSGEPLTEFDKAILELRRPENAALKVKLALLLKNGLDLTKIKIKEKNEQTTKAFQWATKGKQGATKTNTNKAVTTSNSEPFI